MKLGLVVEDSRVIRQVACRILQTFAFDTEEAADADAALSVCRVRMPDVVLLDGNMPGGGALIFLRALRAESEGAGPFVLWCTTENDVPTIAEAMNLGANDYVLKPFDRGLVEARLREAGLMSELVL